jgi:hypothetical protein
VIKHNYKSKGNVGLYTMYYLVLTGFHTCGLHQVPSLQNNKKCLYKSAGDASKSENQSVLGSKLCVDQHCLLFLIILNHIISAK